MHTIAVCPLCGETRYRSTRPLKAGEPLHPELFEPVGDSLPIAVGQPAKCVCGQNLVFRREPDPRAAGGSALTPGVSSGVTTLFAVERDEAIQSMKEVTPDVYVIVTTKRIVKVDIAALVMEAVDGRA